MNGGLCTRIKTEKTIVIVSKPLRRNWLFFNVRRTASLRYINYVYIISMCIRLQSIKCISLVGIMGRSHLYINAALMLMTTFSVRSTSEANNKNEKWDSLYVNWPLMESLPLTTCDATSNNHWIPDSAAASCSDGGISNRYFQVDNMRSGKRKSLDCSYFLLSNVYITAV